MCDASVAKICCPKVDNRTSETVCTHRAVLLFVTRTQRSPEYKARNRDYVVSTTVEALRLARKGQPVRPFAWAMYHDKSR